MSSLEDAGVNHAPGRFARFSDGCEKRPPILVVPKDGLPMIPATRHVVKCPRIFDPPFPRHAPTLGEAKFSVNSSFLGPPPATRLLAMLKGTSLFDTSATSSAPGLTSLSDIRQGEAHCH